MRQSLLCGVALLALISATAAAAQPQRRATPDAARRAEGWSTNIFLLSSERRPADSAQPDAAAFRIPRRAMGWPMWLSREDIPEDLRRRAVATSTLLAIEIDAAARITGCTVLRPSTEPRLDALACRLAFEREQPRPFHIGPGKPVATRWTVAIGWQNIQPGLDEAAFEPPPPLPPAPPRPPIPGIWPRLDWESHIVVAELPQIQRLFPATARRRRGTVSLDLGITVEGGIVDCSIGVSSGDPALDEAACRIASALDLRYVQPCEYCSRSTFPLQIVWNRRGGSHIRLPLFNQHYPESWPQQPRDPADPRTARRYDWGGPFQPYRFSPADFADIANPYINSRYLWVNTVVSPQGRVTSCRLQGSSGEPAIDARVCRLIMAQPRAVRTDIFGDPTTSPQVVTVDLRGVG